MIKYNKVKSIIESNSLIRTLERVGITYDQFLYIKENNIVEYDEVIKNSSENFLYSRYVLDIDKLTNINWSLLCHKQVLTEEFMAENKDRIDWEVVSEWQTLSSDFILKYHMFLNFDTISIYQHLTHEIYDTFSDKLNWKNIAMHQKLSIDDIYKYRKYICFKTISKYQKLDEDFIRKNIDLLDIENIAIFQDVSNIDEIEEYVYESNDMISTQIENLKKNTVFLNDGKDYIYTYKITKANYTSLYSNNAGIRYSIGDTFYSHSTKLYRHGNQFGIYSWHNEGTLFHELPLINLLYGADKYIVLKCKVYIEDITFASTEVISSKLEIVEKIDINKDFDMDLIVSIIVNYETLELLTSSKDRRAAIIYSDELKDSDDDFHKFSVQCFENNIIIFLLVTDYNIDIDELLHSKNFSKETILHTLFILPPYKLHFHRYEKSLNIVDYLAITNSDDKISHLNKNNINNCKILKYSGELKSDYIFDKIIKN